jgi:CRISPR-associated protein (TIGR02710 family)
VAPGEHTLLICTVGGTPEPIIAAIRHWQPARVLLVHTVETKSSADAVTNEPELLQPGDWDLFALHDAQDFSGCVRQMRGLDEQVEAWRRKGVDYRIVVDFTGGTKCMSAALSLVARRWPCAFSYVGGTERTKGGTGIVVSGKEQTLITQNPWNALGYQAIEDACLLFDQHAFMPAAKLLDNARKATDDDSVRRTLSTFHQLCEGYDLWDRFQHQDASQKLADVLKNANDLRSALGPPRADILIRDVKHNQRHLQTVSIAPCSLAFNCDLLANARRRYDEGRYDDAVARLYRAVESLAQVALAQRHQITSTGKVPLDRVPESLRSQWEPRAESGTLLLGLQDTYALLDALDDPLGKAFKKLELDDREKSPLIARNQSILAHGFQPVPKKVFCDLWQAAMKLSADGFAEKDLPVFPRLGTDRAAADSYNQ